LALHGRLPGIVGVQIYFEGLHGAHDDGVLASASFDEAEGVAVQASNGKRRRATKGSLDGVSAGRRLFGAVIRRC
jgi:type 1 fimbria pilin